MEKITKKYVMNTYKKVVKVGYCDLQELLTFAKQIGYTAGVYGWNANVYACDLDVVIVTGYRPFGNVDVDFALCEKYEKKAHELKKNIFDCGKLRSALDALLDEFIGELEA